MSIVLQDRIKALDLILPTAPKPLGVYRPILVIGDYLYVSGQGPILNNQGLITGKVGETLDRDQGKNAARQVGLTLLSTLITHMEPEVRIRRVVKVFGMVNSTSEFEEHPYVINGFSELMAEVLVKRMESVLEVL